MAVAVEQRNRTNEGETIQTAFGRGHDTSLPEARSRRRDDGSGQAATRVVATDHAQRRLADLSSFKPHQVAAQRRPRTEARPRRKGSSQAERGIDKSRPVTEARVEPAKPGMLPRVGR